MGIMLDENKSGPTAPARALKEGFVPLEDFSNPLKYYHHVIVALAPLLRDCLLSFFYDRNPASCK